MIYKAKEGSKAYEFLKKTCEAEEKEYEAYMSRVETAVGFKVEKYRGYHPNRTLIRVYNITAILVDDKQFQSLDPKLWKKTGVVRGLNQIVPIKRTKQGKEIAKMLSSCKSITTHWNILKELGQKEPDSSRFSITQLMYANGHYFVYFDDTIRADKSNPDLEEITMSEYERLTKED